MPAPSPRRRASGSALPEPGLPEPGLPEPGLPEVHVGRDGWLFLIGGSNRVLAQYGRPGVSRRALWRWRGLIAGRVRRCAGLGARYLHAVAPEKLTVYPDRTDGLAYDPGRAPALRLARWLRLSRGGGAWVDLVGAFRAARDGPPLYLRTDTHWTFEGCAVAYRALCAAMGAVPREDMIARRAAHEWPHAGDLGAKFDPPLTETVRDTRFATRARRTYANPFLAALEAADRVGEAHLGSHAVFRNDEPGIDPRRLVVFGDSYAQHHATAPVATLTAFLADTFREVHFLWSTTIDWGYLEAVRPDLVLGEVAERFMIDVPPAGFAIERLAELASERKRAGPALRDA